MEQSNEEQEPLIPAEEVVPEETTPESEEPDIEELKSKAEKADEYKKYADRVAAENKTLKKSLKTNESPPNSTDEIERLRLEVKGYKGDEVDFLMQNGGLKALENPIVVAGIEAIRKKKTSIDATPSGTAKAAVFQKFSEQDLKKMPLEELEKIVPQ